MLKSNKNNFLLKLKTKFSSLNNNIKKLFTYKNLFIFLLSFLVVNIIIGIIFYFFINNLDKQIIKDNVIKYFTINKEYNFLLLFKDNLINNLFNLIIIWLLGISVIGIVIIIFLFFSETFSLGFTMSAIMREYGIKGLIGNICYLFPAKIIYLIAIFLTTFFAIRFSYQIISYLFLKKDNDLQGQMKKYLKMLIIILLLGIVVSILETFIVPFMIKLFTFFIK